LETRTCAKARTFSTMKQVESKNKNWTADETNGC